MQFGRLTLKPCRYGRMLFDGPNIGRCLDPSGESSEAETAVLRAALHPEDTAIDAGANVGDLTTPLARIIRDAGRVSVSRRYGGSTPDRMASGFPTPVSVAALAALAPLHYCQGFSAV